MTSTSTAGPGKVGALRVRPAPLWRADFRERVNESLWFVPTIFAVAALVLANIAVAVDEHLDLSVGARRFLISDPSTAANVAGTVAAATLAFVAVVFATTLVAIQLAASQYSPRAVRIFIRSRLTRLTLGLFIATFMFALATLVSSRANLDAGSQYAPVVSVTLLVGLTIATVFGFIAYLHGVVRSMRVQYLLERIANEVRRIIDHNFPVAAAYVDVDPPRPDPNALEVRFHGRPGVLAALDEHELVELARQRDCWIEMTVAVGDYIGRGMIVARIHAGQADEHDVVRRLLVRGERTFLQDPGFGFRQIADIAIRALSPAVNDPTTGVQAVDRLTDLLAMVGTRPQVSGLRVDVHGAPRLQRPVPDFDQLLLLAFTEIIRYGADSPQVIRRLHAAFDELELTHSVQQRAAIARQRGMLSEAVASALPPAFSAVASVADRKGLG